MKVTLDIKDSKADFFMELVNSLDFVNAAKEVKTENKRQSINDLVVASQHSDAQILKVKKEWGQKTAAEKKENLAAFQTLLINGPVMDDNQYEEYKKLRNRLNTWRQK